MPRSRPRWRREVDKSSSRRHDWLVKTAHVLVAASVIAMALSGCGAGDLPVGEPDGTHATPMPTATQARETGLVPPARPFGGDCANLMTDAEASTILGGKPVAAFSFDSDFFAPEYSVELHAGMHCNWVPVDGTFSDSIQVVVLPADAAGYVEPSGCEPAGETFLAPRCAVEAVVNGTRVSGSIWIDADSTEPVAAATAQFLQLFSERANVAVPAPTPIPAVGAWALPVDCKSVVAAGDFSAVSGLGPAVTGGQTGGTDVRPAPAEVALWGGLGTPFCSVANGSVDVTFVASGGGRWMESGVATAGTPFAIDGYESAYTSPGQVGLTRVDVFDGPNWLHFQVRYTSNAKTLADALFAALNTTAAQ